MIVLSSALFLLLSLPPAQEPQATRPGNVNLLSATLSSRVVELGEPFELSIIARVPSGHIVYFPDSVESRGGIESAGPVRWEVRAVEGDSSELTVVYPLRSFTWGDQALPSTEILLQRTGSIGGSDSRGGSVVRVGRWADVAAAEPESFTRRPIVPRPTQVAAVLPIARPEEGFQPRPPADVLGRSWGGAVLVFLGFVAVLLLGAVMMGLRWAIPRILAMLRRRAARQRPRSARSLAVEELDALLAQGLHTAGRMDEFYSRSTHTARHYVEALDVSCGPALTYRELVSHLAEAPGVRSFSHVLRRAEVVRFGTHLPEPEDAVEDLGALRRWVLEYPSRNGSS